MNIKNLEYLFIALYHRQLFEDNKMIKIISFVGPEGPKACANKAGI